MTEPPPGPHAEGVALRQAGDKARGATLYSTLEPCSHTGRTPPCTEAIIAAGIAEVHYAIRDPNPGVTGDGHAILEAAGIRVSAGECAEEAARVHEAFLKHRTTGLPFVIAKFAASLDGRIAAASGDSRWVSGPETRQWSHNLRTRIDAILAGSDTVIIDDPLLTARPGDQDAERQPLRVVVDSRGRIPPMARVFTGPRTRSSPQSGASNAWRARSKPGAQTSSPSRRQTTASNSSRYFSTWPSVTSSLSSSRAVAWSSAPSSTEASSTKSTP